jgi:NTP pyrophosphatase (non-canonical NTP hydrolase)
MSQINDLCRKAHETAKEKGWHEKEVPVSEFISNTHGELSEAFEEYRKGFPLRAIYYSGEEKEKPEGFSVELADAVVRIFDFCGLHGIDLEKAIQIKMAFNKTRSYRHGGKIV